MPEETVDREPQHEAAGGGDAPPLRPVALRRADRWVLGEARSPEPGQPFEVLLADGSRQTFARPPITMTWVTPGSLLHEAAQDPNAVQQRFDTEPGQVVAQLLRDLGRPQVKGDLVQRVADLHLRAPGDWWPTVSRALKAHPNVRVEGGKYSWSDTPLRAPAGAPARTVAARPPAPPRTSPVRPAPTARPTGPDAPGTGSPDTGTRGTGTPGTALAGSGTPGTAPAGSGTPGTASAAPGSPVRPAAAAPEDAPAARQPTETSRQTQARLTVLRTLRQLAQGAGNEERLLRELESTGAELPAGSPESALADVLARVLLDPEAFDTTPLPGRGLETSTRYDLARLALRLRAHRAAVQALLGLERLDTERLLAQVPWEEPGFAVALGEHLAAAPALDGRTAQRLEAVLRQLALALADAGDRAGVQAGALGLLTVLAAAPGVLPAGLQLLARTALRECLRAGVDPEAVRDLPAPGLLALWTGPLRAADLPLAAMAALVVALDAADRADVLGDPALWARTDVPALAAEPGVAGVLLRRDLTGTLLASAVRNRLDGGDPRQGARLLALPDELLAALPGDLLTDLLDAAARRSEHLRPAG